MPAPSYRSSHKHGLRAIMWRHLNFFRVHLLWFTLSPLIFSVILYTSNGRYPIAYIDALFLSVSAGNVCGLSTVDLSQSTPWQQVILFLQMFSGSPVVMSWFIVYTRRYFFAQRFDYLSRTKVEPKPRIPGSPDLASKPGRQGLPKRVSSFLRQRGGFSPVTEEYSSKDRVPVTVPKDKNSQKLRPEMIRRISGPLKRINPSGWIDEGIITPLKKFSTRIGTAGGQVDGLTSSLAREPEVNLVSSPIEEQNVSRDIEAMQAPIGADIAPQMSRRDSDWNTNTSGFAISEAVQLGRPQLSYPAVGTPRTTTIEFAPTVTRHYIPIPAVSNRNKDIAKESTHGELRRTISQNSLHSGRYTAARRSLTHHSTQHTSQGVADYAAFDSAPTRHDLGGFPMPHEILAMLFRHLFPRAANRLRRTITIPATTALAGGELGRTAFISGTGQMAAAASIPEGHRPVPYISFDAIIGRNSDFIMLKKEHLEELGGVEYRALNALLWLIILYHFGIQLVSFVVIAPYMAISRWDYDFVPPALIRPVASTWFCLFQVISAYSNTGLSLVDQSMLPFQTAYPLIFFMIICTLAGNAAFPIFFRFLIWVISKMVPARSRLYETLRFLLDHPRRCFVYLFPSHQTWFLLIVLLLLVSFDFLCFIVLDIGIPAVESIPSWNRIADGLLQVTTIRASGLSIIPVSSLAPAVQIVFVVTMYLNVYPIAMSVRSTNVYEERSLGIYRNSDQLSAAEEVFQTGGSRMAMWGRYLATHARYQLSFDMWWLSLATFLICIIERGKLMNPENQGWFNVFAIFFEIVSAYGSVGLSFGIPNQNYSLSGAFRPLSKLVICLVMIRGRHRGLPVAIDRAVVLPYEFRKPDEDLDSDTGEDDGQTSIQHETGSDGNVSHPIGVVACGDSEVNEERQIEAQVKGE